MAGCICNFGLQIQAKIKEQNAPNNDFGHNQKTQIMKKIAFFLILLSIFSSCMHCKHSAKQVVEEKSTPEPFLVGECWQSTFDLPICQPWYTENWQTYTPDMSQLRAFQPDELAGFRIVTVFGSWCSDSQREVPHMLKILHAWGFDQSNLKLLAVDRNKKAPEVPENWKIERVPTFIFYKNDQEIGRIVETPSVSLEADMVEILKKANF